MQYLHYNECKPRGTFDFPIEFYHINSRHPQYVMPYHWHRECEIIHVLQGSLQLTLDTGKSVMGPGDTAFAGSGVIHAATPDNCLYQCLVFDMDMLLQENNACKKYIQRFADSSIAVWSHLPREDKELSGAVKEMLEAMGEKPEGYQLITQGALYRMLGLVIARGYYCENIPEGSRTQKKITQLKRALRMIETAYGSQLKLSDLAGAAGMSPKYFCRFFQEMTRRTPMDYLNSFRVEHACFQLISTDLSVTEIAYECGFNDLSYFIRAFKKYKGETPRQYLRGIHGRRQAG